MKVYAGIDPLTGCEIRLRRTYKTERAAQIELGKLVEQAGAGRQPDSAVTVARLLDQYVPTAGWDVSTRESNLGYIRRTIRPAQPGSAAVRLGSIKEYARHNDQVGFLGSPGLHAGGDPGGAGRQRRW